VRKVDLGSTVYSRITLSMPLLQTFDCIGSSAGDLIWNDLQMALRITVYVYLILEVRDAIQQHSLNEHWRPSWSRLS